MSFVWTLVGTIAQFLLAGFLFMVVVFSASGLGNDGKLDKTQLDILNLSMYALPASCIVSALIVWYFYRHGGSAACYGWYGLPWVATAVYIGYALHLSHRV